MSTEWKLVPMHPTEEMIQATLDTGLYHDGEEAARAVLIDEYKAMVKAAPPVPQVASEPAKVRACIACAVRDAAIDQPPSQEVTPAYLEWLKTKSRSAGVAGNEAWNAGVEWALTQAETSATASGDAEREALIERLKAQSLAHRYEAETDSADLIDEAVAALHSTGKPGDEQ